MERAGKKDAFPAEEKGPIRGHYFLDDDGLPPKYLKFSTELTLKKLYSPGLHGSSFFCDETGAQLLGNFCANIKV